MNVKYSVSSHPYTGKPTDAMIAQMKWQVVSTSVEELEEYVGKGYTINHIYNAEAYDDDGYISKKNATMTHFLSSQIVFVDIDQTHFASIQAFTDVLSILPTFSYYTPSDALNARRFRLVYVIDTELNSVEWNLFSRFLHNQIEKDTMEELQDKCGERNNQYVNGAVNISSVVPGDGYIRYDDYIEAVCRFYSEKAEVSQSKPTPFNRKTREGFDSDFIGDLEHLPAREIKWRYGHRYPYVKRTENEEWLSFYDSVSGETYPHAYQYTDEDYAEREWYGKKGEKVRDGHHRRKKLYMRACITRLINPNLNKSAVLYNVWKDCVEWFDNRDKVLTVDLLIEDVNCAFHFTIEELRQKLSYKKVVIIHSSIRDRTLQARIRGYALRQLHWQRIGAIYDVSKSIKQNLEELKGVGLKVSKTAIYRFVKENNVKRPSATEEIQKLSEQGLSKTEIMKLLGVTIGQVKWARKKKRNKSI